MAMCSPCRGESPLSERGASMGWLDNELPNGPKACDRDGRPAPPRPRGDPGKRWEPLSACARRGTTEGRITGTG